MTFFRVLASGRLGTYEEGSRPKKANADANSDYNSRYRRGTLGRGTGHRTLRWSFVVRLMLILAVRGPVPLPLAGTGRRLSSPREYINAASTPRQRISLRLGTDSIIHLYEQSTTGPRTYAMREKPSLESPTTKSYFRANREAFLDESAKKKKRTRKKSSFFTLLNE